MRNVTIVESNVEPNKEHLWFYNGKLKWFGPNGWGEIYSQASSPTTTPKPVVPPTTTTTSTTSTTSTAPGPGVATTPIGMRVYNYTDATIDIIVSGANSVNSHIPANGDDYIIGGVYPSTSGGNITLYIKVRGSGSISPDIQVNRTVDVYIMGEISGTSIEQFKSILNEDTIDIPYTGSDALHSICLVVSILEGDTTTTSTTTTSTTPEPVAGSIRFTNKTNVYIQFSNIYYGTVNATLSPPIQPEQTCVLRYFSDPASVSEENLISFNSLKITAIRNGEIVQEYVPYKIIAHGVGHSYYDFSFKGLLDNGVTDVLIQDEDSSATTSTTTSTPEPILVTPFGVRIYNNLADKVDITATAAEVVNKSIEPNGVTTFQILPISTGGIFSLHVKSENLHDTVSTIKVYAHGRVGDYNREYNNTIVNGGVFTFFYDENAALSSIDMNIELSKYVEEVTTTTTVTPNVG